MGHSGLGDVKVTINSIQCQIEVYLTSSLACKGTTLLLAIFRSCFQFDRLWRFTV